MTAHLGDVLFVSAFVMFCSPTALVCLGSVVATVLSCVVLHIKLNCLTPDQCSDVECGGPNSSNKEERIHDGSSKDGSSSGCGSSTPTVRDDECNNKKQAVASWTYIILVLAVVIVEFSVGWLYQPRYLGWLSVYS